jgi:sirohydrochlorin ferrochelatase
MTSTSLIIIAHGSRRQQSNDEVRRLADQIEGRAGARFASVCCAYLELADPDIPSAIEQAIAGGADELRLVPYFLSAGRHVAHDIPEIVAQKRRQHPDINIHLDEHLGSAPGMAQLVIDLLGQPPA